MNLIRTSFTFSARIGRMQFLFGLAALAMLSPFSLATILSSNALRDLVGAVPHTGLPALGWSLVLLFTLTALMAKRLRDRGKSRRYASLFYLPAALEITRFFLGRIPGLQRFAYWSFHIAPWLGATGLWFLIELRFYKGQLRPNAYGPEPGQRPLPPQ